MEDERNLLDHIYVLIKWRRLIIVSVLVVSLVMVAVSLILPKTWTAETTILPPDEAIDTGGLSTILGGATPMALSGFLGGGTPNQLFSSMLESKRILGLAVDEFELVEVYESPYREHAIETLRENVEIELGRDQVLTLAVTASDPQLAAELANTMVRELDAYNRYRKSRQARALRLFLDGRVAAIQDDLERSGQALQAFQEKHGLVDFEAQTGAAVEVVKSIVSELTLLEAQLGVSEKMVSPEHEDRRRLQLEVETLRESLERLIGGIARQIGDDIAVDVVHSLSPPMSELPHLGFDYALLSLDVKVKEQIVGILRARLEEAKYKEALNTPTLQVLDVATPPKVRTSPRRTLLVVSAASLSLVVSVLLAFVLESWIDLRNAEGEKLAAIGSLVRGRDRTIE